MAPRAERGQGASRYPLRFGTAAFLLISITLVLVLFVLPQRYVLSTGFRESGMSFPSPTTPFVPVAVVSVPARPLPELPAVILPGPAELFWQEVLPLLRSGDLAAALPLFETYLAEHPDDLDVRRELAVTLIGAGRRADAVPVLRAVLAAAPDADLRLLLARTLRDLGRTDEASREYGRVAALRPNDEALALEWAQAHAWVAEYEEAAAILAAALRRMPGSVPLSVELARVRYSMGDVRGAASLLAAMNPDSRDAVGAQPLWAAVVQSFFVRPEVVPVPAPPTLLERATAARVAGDFESARALLEEALERSPDSRMLWLAYANLLEYELDDLEGAREALLELERLGAYDPSIQLRLGRLEIWTGRNADATRRLEELLAALDAGAVGGATVSRADVLALLGDLRRWEGDRIAAAERYNLALQSEPANEQARDGLTLLEAEVTRQLVDVEAPRVAGTAYSVADTDDYFRFDAGGEWVDVNDRRWVVGGAAGQRWIGGYDLAGLDATRQGPFVDLEVARWWRWGTVRTGVDLGVQRVRSGWDALFGGSVRHRNPQGTDTELRYEHGPGYPIAGTLQSLFADVVQDRLLLSHARRLGERWSISATADAARLRASSNALPGTTGSSDRLQLSVGAGRAMTRSLTVGVAARALTFTDASPLTPTGSPLYWDPVAAFSVGPYAQLDLSLSDYWKLSSRLNPGLALLDERRPIGVGYELVPHASVEAGIRREGARIWTAFDLFYYQGQFDGYRTYGARLTLSARDFSTLGGSR